MAELISNEPLRDESHALASELPAEQAVEAGEIVREAVLARTDASRSQRMVHQADGSCAWEAAQRGALRAGHPSPCCHQGRRVTFVHPLSAHPPRLVPVGGPGASRVYSTFLWYTAGMPLAPRAHAGPALSFACPCRRCVLY